MTQADSDLPVARKARANRAPQAPQAPRAPRAQHGTRTGPRAVLASDVARRTASLILEALTGVRTTQEAAGALGVALPRDYVLETRALSGLVGALEPRSRGRQRRAAERISALEGEVARLERELRRFQALQRASQRALGLVAAPAARGGATKAPRSKGDDGGKPRRSADRIERRAPSASPRA